MRGGSGRDAVSGRRDGGATTRDAVGLALGTLTVLPVRPPEVVDRRVASWAMTLAPLVGALLGVLAGAFLWLLGAAGVGLPGPGDLLPVDRSGSWRADPLLGAALTVGLLAVLTRAMHLDGLADTADGLGSGKPADRALEVMRRGDVGPFGVVTLVLVLLVQVLALGDLVASGAGASGLLLALVTSRSVLPLLCSRGLRAARPEGLGQLVVGTVGRVQLGMALASAVGVLVLVGLLAFGASVVDPGLLVQVGVAVAAGLAAATYLARRAVRRLGGLTGDVLGASVEAAFTASLVALALAT